MKNHWGRFFSFSILFHFIPFSDHFLRYLGKTRHFFIKPMRKYEFFTVGGGLTSVGSKISLVKKLKKNSFLFLVGDILCYSNVISRSFILSNFVLSYYKSFLFHPILSYIIYSKPILFYQFSSILFQSVVRFYPFTSFDSFIFISLIQNLSFSINFSLNLS